VNSVYSSVWLRAIPREGRLLAPSAGYGRDRRVWPDVVITCRGATAPSGQITTEYTFHLMRLSLRTAYPPERLAPIDVNHAN
jgi:hypothetical protein